MLQSLKFNFFKLALFLFFIFLLWQNCCIPLIPGDDFLYCFAFSSEEAYKYSRIDSFSELFSSIKNHFLYYNNRIFPHAILQVLLIQAKGLFNLLNPVVFLLLAYFINIVGRSKEQETNTAAIVLLISISIWCFHPDLGMSYFWMTGSLNYSWMLIPQLALIYLLIKLWNSQNPNPINLIFLTIICALTNEHVIISLFLFCLLICGKQLKGKNLEWHIIAITLILLTGGLVMLNSPSLALKSANEAIEFESNMSHTLEFLKRNDF